MRIATAVPLILLPMLASAQAPALQVGPARLSFITSATGNGPPPQVVHISATRPGSFAWTAATDVPWLELSATSGTAPADLEVGVDIFGLRPGQHSGRVVVTGREGSSPVVVSVSLQILSPSAGAERPATEAAALTLSSPAGSRGAVTATLSLEGGPGTPATWRVRPDQAWLQVDPASGELPARLTVTAAPEGLAPGDHKAELAFTDADGTPWMKVAVVLVVAGNEALSIATDALPPATRNLPYAQAIPIKGGKPPYNIRVVDGRLPLGLSLTRGAIAGTTRFAGTYPLMLTVTDSATPPATVTQPVLLQVIVLYQDTALIVSPPAVALTANASQRSQGTRIGIGSGRQPLAWRAAADASWLLIAPERGISPSVLQVDVNAAALQPGTYTATITVTMEGAPNSPARIPVQVVVRK